jgi:hypothetical protein
MEYILLAIALIILFLYVPREHMTNDDLIKTLHTFGVASKSSTPDKQEPIYGPKTTKQEPQPAPTKNSADSSDVYPDIYGPEIISAPGKKKTVKHESDNVNDDIYQFNPDFKKSFPTSSDEPQPFLTDFSKFQH